MSILTPRKPSKRKRKANSSQTTPQVIIVEDDNEVRSVDLTRVDQGDPEVIVLDDSIVHSGRVTRSSSRSSVVDLTDLTQSFITPAKRKDSEQDIQIVNVKLSSKKLFKQQTSPQTSTSTSEITVVDCVSTPKSNKKRKRKKKSKGRPQTSSTINTSTKSGSSTSLSPSESLPRKKRKLQDISNIHSAASCSTSPSLQPTGLSENALKYYENISKVVGVADQEKKESSTSLGSSTNIPVRNHIENNERRKSKRLTNKLSPIRVCLEANKKRKVFTPQNSFRHRDTWHSRRQFVQRHVQNSPGRPVRSMMWKGIRNSVRKIGETNSFNPNPFELDLEGLRPIVIDGCNVAIGHGKGKFSPKGLKICVDYFAARGHTNIKIFLPQFRQEEFSADLLETIKTKCDVVFTPSQCINGQRRTPYDDRFIVQYATEFGGVIVSTDNYRDLSQENPRWQDTIAKRLLMFTWVDDFLMFPVDPLGRSGPMLEEFLRF